LIEQIPIDRIVPGRQFRTQPIPEPKELARSMKRVGQLQPICVKKKNGSYEIIYGHRRYYAALLAGMTEMECRVVDIDAAEALLVAFTENVHREDMTAIEKGRALLEIFRAGGIEKEPAELVKDIIHIENVESGKTKKLRPGGVKIQQICEDIGVPLRDIRRWLQAICTDEAIQEEELAEEPERRLPDKVVARIGTIEDKELQKEVYRTAKEGDLTANQVSRLVTEVKKEKPEETEKTQVPEEETKKTDKMFAEQLMIIQAGIDTFRNMLLIAYPIGESAKKIADRLKDMSDELSVLAEKILRKEKARTHEVKGTGKEEKKEQEKEPEQQEFDWSDCDFVTTEEQKRLMNRMAKKFIEEDRLRFGLTSDNTAWLIKNFIDDIRKTRIRANAMFIILELQKKAAQ